MRRAGCFFCAFVASGCFAESKASLLTAIPLVVEDDHGLIIYSEEVLPGESQTSENLVVAPLEESRSVKLWDVEKTSIGKDNTIPRATSSFVKADLNDCFKESFFFVE